MRTLSLILILNFLFAGCVHLPGDQKPDFVRSVAAAGPASSQLPDLVGKNSIPDAAIQAWVKNAVRLNKISPDKQDETVLRLSHYMGFLGLNIAASPAAPVAQATAAPTTADLKKVKPFVMRPPLDRRALANGQAVKNNPDVPVVAASLAKPAGNLDGVRSRILQSSTQFLFCDSFEDWECLEKTPSFTPLSDFRKEVVANSLGAPIAAGDSFNPDFFFTTGWDDNAKPTKMVAQYLADRLNADVGQKLSMAMYGIDDITGSMKPVYDAIEKYANDKSVQVRGVVDVNGIDTIVGGKKWILQYATPNPANDSWLFADANDTKDPDAVHAQFQYDGTPVLLRRLNANIQNDSEARLRIEWPPTPAIMHNKFMVLEKDGKKTVWTGTANIAKTCMGNEHNANMSIYIRNNYIADAFLDEFNLMYEFNQQSTSVSAAVEGAGSNKQLTIGRFHHNKIPISHRLFTFKDGTKVRVHFAPTDDAEHRVIIPMLLSARAGDMIRISMFGGAGYELVRAFQYAAAQGAQIRIVFDKALSQSATSWVKSVDANLHDNNPYRTVAADAIQVRVNTWPGLNHYKVGSLTRNDGDSKKAVAEEIIIGSQNWSTDGNDDNDENLISIQNFSGVPAAKAFNTEFDSHLWVKSVPEGNTTGTATAGSTN